MSVSERSASPAPSAVSMKRPYPRWFQVQTERMCIDMVDSYAMHRFILTPTIAEAVSAAPSVAPSYNGCDQPKVLSTSQTS